MTEELGEDRPRPAARLDADHGALAELPDSYADHAAAAEMALVLAVIGEGRSVRSELNVPVSARPPLLVTDAGPRERRSLSRTPAICKMPPVGEIWFDAAEAMPRRSWPRAPLALPVAEFIDLDAEKARLAKEIAALAADIDRTAKKLANPDFVARAPDEVVEENRERLAEAEAAKSRLDAALRRLEAVG